MRIQLIQIVIFKGNKQENEIFTDVLSEMKRNNNEKEMHCTYELRLPSNLPATFSPNRSAQLNDIPSITINYEFRFTVHIHDVNTSNLQLVVPIDIE